MKKIIAHLIFTLLIVGKATGQASPAVASKPKSAAIVVQNHAGKELNDKIPMLRDYVVAKFTDLGFEIISAETTMKALTSFAKPGQTEETTTDRLFDEGTSAVRLTQTLQVDYLIVAAIQSFGKTQKQSTAYGAKTANTECKLRVSYKILEGVQGKSLAGDVISVSKLIPVNDHISVMSDDVVNELLEEASGQMAEACKGRLVAGKIRAPEPVMGEVEFSVICGMQDMASVPLSIPEVKLTSDNRVILTPTKTEVQALDVAVEMDGVMIGTAPGTFRAKPGIHKIRLTREGFAPLEKNVNIASKMTLRLALNLSDQGYARWRDNTGFLQTLENNRKLTDAEVKVLEGKAQMLRQSGYKVEVKQDIKVDNKTRSLFN